jgi:hypothetical protein
VNDIDIDPYPLTDEGQVQFILDHFKPQYHRDHYEPFQREVVLGQIVGKAASLRLHDAQDRLKREHTDRWHDDLQRAVKFGESLGSYARITSVKKLLEKILLDSFVVEGLGV